MWIVYDDNNNKSWEFSDKESMIDFVNTMDYEGLIDDSWWVEFDYLDRNIRNDTYPITDFI